MTYHVVADVNSRCHRIRVQVLMEYCITVVSFVCFVLSGKLEPEKYPC